MSTTVAYADSTKDAVNAFRDSLGTGQFVLKNFSGQEKVHANWTGSALEFDPPRWRMIAVVTIDSVKLKGHTLVMRCTRHVAMRDASDRLVLFQRPSDAEIDIDLGGADPASALPRLKGSLFYPSIADALAALPAKVQKWLPARIDEKMPDPKRAPQVTDPGCDCAAPDRTGCNALDATTAGVTPPKFLGGHDPEFSDSARKAKLNGNVIVRFTVDKAGHPEDVWVARPLGLGLDEAAAASILTYRFKPALCHDVPVSVDLMSFVNFQIY